MEYNFKCPFCSQELSVDDSVAGTETNCPTCNEMLIIPTPAQVRASHLTVTGSTEGNSLIKKSNRPLEVTAKGDRKVRLKTFRHQDCVKDGRDKFDDTVSDFLQKVAEENVVSVQPIHYSVGGQTDYGVAIVYKGRATD